MIEDQNLGRFAEKKFNLLAPPTNEKKKRVSSEDNGRRLCQSDHLALLPMPSGLKYFTTLSPSHHKNENYYQGQLANLKYNGKGIFKTNKQTV